MTRLLTLSDLKRRLVRETKAAGGIRRWATMHGIHPSVVDHFLRGQRGLPPQVIKALGATQVVRYRVEN